MDLTFEGLGKLFLKFRQSRYFRPFYLVILGLVVTGLFSVTFTSGATFCLGAILIPGAVLIIPYWLGERSLKRFAINALPVFAIAIVLIAAFQTNALLNAGTPALTSEGFPSTNPVYHYTFWNGTVDPYRGAADQLYTFHVRLTVTNSTGVQVPVPTTATISTNLTQAPDFISGSLIVLPMQVDSSRNNTANGTWYVAEKALPASIYGFYFWVNDTNANDSVFSTFDIGPLNAPVTTYYVAWLELTLEYLIFPVSFYFIIVFMYWYTIRMRKMRARMVDRARGEKLDLDKGESKDKAAPAGGDEAAAGTAKTRKAAAFTCTNCGADVTEDDAKCPKCGAVFED